MNSALSAVGKHTDSGTARGAQSSPQAAGAGEGVQGISEAALNCLCRANVPFHPELDFQHHTAAADANGQTPTELNRSRTKSLHFSMS